MELEIRSKDPTGKLHSTIVKTGVELLTPDRINSMIFRGGRNIIFTPQCPYTGTQIKAHSFRIRSIETSIEKQADFFYKIDKEYSPWTKWFNYDKFYDKSFPVIEEELVTRKIVIKIARKH